MKPLVKNDDVSQVKKISKLALVAFILGIISLLSDVIIVTTLLDKPIPESALFYPCFITIAMGVLAIFKIKYSSNLKGKGWAIAGLALASIPILAFLFLVVIFVFFSDSINIPW